MKGTYCLGLCCIMDANRDGHIMGTYCLGPDCIMYAIKWLYTVKLFNDLV